MSTLRSNNHMSRSQAVFEYSSKESPLLCVDDLDLRFEKLEHLLGCQLTNTGTWALNAFPIVQIVLLLGTFLDDKSDFWGFLGFVLFVGLIMVIFASHSEISSWEIDAVVKMRQPLTWAGLVCPVSALALLLVGFVVLGSLGYTLCMIMATLAPVMMLHSVLSHWLVSRAVMRLRDELKQDETSNALPTKETKPHHNEEPISPASDLSLSIEDTIFRPLERFMGFPRLETYDRMVITLALPLGLLCVSGHITGLSEGYYYAFLSTCAASSSIIMYAAGNAFQDLTDRVTAAKGSGKTLVPLDDALCQIAPIIVGPVLIGLLTCSILLAMGVMMICTWVLLLLSHSYVNSATARAQFRSAQKAFGDGLPEFQRKDPQKKLAEFREKLDASEMAMGPRSNVSSKETASIPNLKAADAAPACPIKPDSAISPK